MDNEIMESQINDHQQPISGDEEVAHESDSQPKIGDWYAIHTYSGFEERVKSNLEMIINNSNAHDLIYEIVIPREPVTEIKGGKEVSRLKKMLPGYVLVRAKRDKRAFELIRSTPGVTGFVGAGSRPTRLTQAEVDSMLKSQEEEIGKKPKVTFDFQVGDNVRVKEGPFADFPGSISEINEDQMKVKVLVNVFGRETPLELEFNQIGKL